VQLALDPVPVIEPVIDSAITTVEVGATGISDDNFVEGNDLVFNVELNVAPITDATFSFSLGGGTASAADYNQYTFSDGVTFNSASNEITVPAGVSSFSVTLPTVDDAEVESLEFVPVSIGGVSATGGIIDNDHPAITSVEVGTTGISDDNFVEGNDLVFNVELSVAPINDATYSFSLAVVQRRRPTTTSTPSVMA
jgi:hypothetical protein